MYSHIVMTTGVSLFAFQNVFGKWTREKNYFLFNNGRPNPHLHEGETEAQATRRWLHDAQLLLAETSLDPQRVSAEYTMLHALRRQNKLDKQPSVDLFHSATLGGKLAAQLLAKVLEYEFQANVKLHEIVIDINVDRVQLNRQIGDYMKKLGDALMYGYPLSTCFAPIGGYKVMTSFGYIVGAFHGYPTAYVHEESQQRLHIIPPIPLDIPTAFFEKYADFIRRLRQEDLIDYESLNYHEREVVDSYPALFDVDEGCVCFNPFGEFLFKREQYRASLETKVMVSDSVLRFMKSQQANKKFIPKQIALLMEKAKKDCDSDRGELYHERSFKNLKGKKLQYHLYKGASNGRHGDVFRAAWDYDKSKDVLRVNYVWSDHELYENEAAQGRGLIKDEGAFTDITSDIYREI